MPRFQKGDIVAYDGAPGFGGVYKIAMVARQENRENQYYVLPVGEGTKARLWVSESSLKPVLPRPTPIIHDFRRKVRVRK